MSAILKFYFQKRKQLRFSEVNYLLRQAYTKRLNFACDIYIFLKTMGNKNKQWTHSTPVKLYRNSALSSSVSDKLIFDKTYVVYVCIFLNNREFANYKHKRKHKQTKKSIQNQSCCDDFEYIFLTFVFMFPFMFVIRKLPIACKRILLNILPFSQININFRQYHKTDDRRGFVGLSFYVYSLCRCHHVCLNGSQLTTNKSRFSRQHNIFLPQKKMQDRRGCLSLSTYCRKC